MLAAESNQIILFMNRIAPRGTGRIAIGEREARLGRGRELSCIYELIILLSYTGTDYCMNRAASLYTLQ
jgi:hypothetical protein